MYVDVPPSAVCGVCAAGARAGFDSDALPSPPRLRRDGRLPEFEPWPGGGRGVWGPLPDPWDWAPRPTGPLLLQPTHGQPCGLPVTPNPPSWFHVSFTWGTQIAKCRNAAFSPLTSDCNSAASDPENRLVRKGEEPEDESSLRIQEQSINV